MSILVGEPLEPEGNARRLAMQNDSGVMDEAASILHRLVAASVPYWQSGVRHVDTLPGQAVALVWGTMSHTFDVRAKTWVGFTTPAGGAATVLYVTPENDLASVAASHDIVPLDLVTRHVITPWQPRTVTPPPGIPSWVAPTTGDLCTSPTPTLIWTPQDHATSYDVKIYDDSATVELLSTSVLAPWFSLQVPAGILTPEMDWRRGVRAIGPGGTSDWDFTGLGAPTGMEASSVPVDAVAYWGCDEDLTDSIGGIGSLVSGTPPTFDLLTPFRNAGSLVFDGSGQYVKTPSAIWGGETTVLAAWIKPTGGNTERALIFGTAQTMEGDAFLQVSLYPDGHVGYDHVDPFGGGDHEGGECGRNIVDGTWHLIIFVVNTGFVGLFVDYTGGTEGDHFIRGGGVGATGAVYFGGFPDVEDYTYSWPDGSITVQPFAGEMDEMGYWTYDLTDVGIPTEHPEAFEWTQCLYNNGGGDPWPFFPPMRPAITAPAEGDTGVSVTPTILWDAVPTPVDAFVLQIGDTSDPYDLAALIYTDTIGSNIPPGPETVAYTVPSGVLASGASYQIRMAAVNKNGQSAWSDIILFTTAP